MIRITRKEVLNNILQIKDNLLKSKKVLLNRKTGAIQFQDKALFHPADPWREIHIQVDSLAHFAAKNERDEPLKSSELEPVAWRIMTETLEALNLITSLHPEETALESLSKINLLASLEKIEELPGWKGKINRFKAEEKLFDQPYGTYLLRYPDTITQTMAEALAQSNQMDITPYLITIKGMHSSISEVLLLQTNQGWTVYRDNPDLKDLEYFYFNSIQGALKKLLPKAHLPLH